MSALKGQAQGQISLVVDASLLPLLERHLGSGRFVPVMREEAPAEQAAVFVHDSEEGVEQSLSNHQGVVLWPSAEGVILSSWLGTRAQHQLARQFFQGLVAGRPPGIRTPSLRSLLACYPFLGRALVEVLADQLRAGHQGQDSICQFTLLKPEPLRVLRHGVGPWKEQEVEAGGQRILKPRVETEPGSGRGAGAFQQPGDLPPDVAGTAFSLLPRLPQRMLEVSTLACSSLPLVAAGYADLALGRGLDFQHADLCALFEGLERRCIYYEGQVPVVRGSFDQLRAGQPVLDPRTLLLPPAREASPASRLVPFEPSLELDWIHGYSFQQRRTILVPARSVFLGYQADRLLLHESSSGCALGASLEEAFLHALLELIERDAFLMTWYARHPVVRLELATARDRRIHHLCDSAERKGYEIRAYRTTVDTPVPSVWVMAVARGDQGPKTLSSAGAHLRAERAILSGLVEVLASLELMGPAFDASRGRECMADPSKVDTPMDHFHLFGIPEQARALDFLERGGRQPITEAFAQESFLAEGRDLTGKLDLLLRRLLENHPDTVLVDLTPPRLARQGLYCVRALVPDMLPMTFGHGNRRTHGCARLKRWRARQELSTDSSDELPPHPFP